MTKVKQPSDCGLAYAQPPPEVNLSHALTPHRGIQCELGGHDRGYRYQLLAGHHVTRHGDVSATIDVKAEGDGESILGLFKGFHTAIPTGQRFGHVAALDGFAVNERSEKGFWSFMKSAPRARAAEVVLVDNGNLRAVWDGNDGEHFGLQFVGSHALQYVIFRRRTGSSHISRVAGNDTLDGVKRQIRAFELEALLET